MSAGAATVAIRGKGVAVATSIQLLRCEGFKLVGRAEPAGASAPVVMLSNTALALLRDIFGRADLLAGRVRIARRIVAWGNGDPIILPHEGIVVSGADLAAELASPPIEPPGGDAFFTLRGEPPVPGAALHCFGQREATAAAVDLAPGADAQACHVEATAIGWLFLIPFGQGKAWLLGVGDSLDALLGRCRHVAAQISSLAPVVARFETAPRLLEQLAGDDWLACGSAAIAFDPICGDGTAQAAREGVLAAAVIAGIRAGEDDVDDRAALLTHYRAMLLAGMRRHLQISLPFYRSGGTSVWWREQAAAVTEGYAWCTARLATMPEPRFVLRGNRLVRRELAA